MSTITFRTRRRFSEPFSTITSRSFPIPSFPINHALASAEFPDSLERLGAASRESVERYREYVALIYVDVVEFDGEHIRRFYSEMSERFDAFARHHHIDEQVQGRLRPGLTAGSAMMLATRIFLNYFSVEILFGVHDHFGKGTDAVIREISDVLRHGMLGNSAPAPKPRARKPSRKS